MNADIRESDKLTVANFQIGEPAFIRGLFLLTSRVSFVVSKNKAAFIAQLGCYLNAWCWRKVSASRSWKKTRRTSVNVSAVSSDFWIVRDETAAAS